MQKSISSFLVFLLCFCLICQQSCFAISLPAPHLPPPPGENKKGIELKLTDGLEKLEPAAAKNKVAALSPINQAQLKHLLDRLPPESSTAASSTFNIPPSPTAPQKPGGTVKQTFPPKESKTRPPGNSILKPLTVLHHTPECEVRTVKQITITFSQPMVPLASAESNAEAKNIPVHMSPETPGHWRWLGTQTLAFTPEGKFLPQSTNYRLEIPAGTTSTNGAKLSQTVSWSINTPAAQAMTMMPSDGQTSVALKPVMLAIFEQKIDPSQVIKAITATQAGISVPLRLATDEEIKEAKEIAEQIKSTAKNSWIAFIPVKQLQKGQKVSVKIGPNVSSKEGPNKSKTSQTFAFYTYGPLLIQSEPQPSMAPQESFYLRLSNPIDVSKFNSKMITVTPAVRKLQVSASEGIYIQGDFQANTKYTFSLDRNIKDVFGQTLSGPNIATVKVTESGPELSEPNGPLVIIQKGKQSYFNFLSRNAKQMKVCLYACEPAEFSKYMQESATYRSWHEKPADYRELQNFKKINEKLISPTHSSEFTETKIELQPYLQNGANNLVATVEVLPRKQNEIHRFAAWIQSTNIGLDSFIDGTSLVVMASRLDNGHPISGAKVTLLRSKKTALTDDQGIARLPYDAKLRECILCQNADDQAFESLDLYYANSEAPEFQLPLNPSPRTNDGRWYCVTDRNLYKPGEKVQTKGWLREFTAGPEGDLRLMKNVTPSVDYRVTDIQGNEISKGTASLDDAGGFNFSFEVPKTANLGDGTISLTTNAKQNNGSITTSSAISFKIAEFRRPEFELSVSSASSTALVFGDLARVSASAKYFAGGPLSDSSISWRVNTSTGQYSPPGWSEFSFGKSRVFRGYYGGSYDTDENESTQNREAQTDSSGKNILQIDVTRIADALPVSITAEATVQDVNRQEWADKTTLLLHSASAYVGLKSDKQMYRADEPLKLSSIVTDIDGKLIAGAPVHLEVISETDEYKDGEYKTVKNTLVSHDLNSEGKEVSNSIKVASGGQLKIVATTTDTKGRKNKTEISVWKEETVEKKITQVEQQKVIVVADRKEYQPGQTASIMVQAPFKPARGIITLRHNGILKSLPADLKNGSTVVEIAITEQMLPNVLVQADLVGNNSSYATGSSMLGVAIDSRKLKVEVTPVEKSIAPGQKTKVNLQITKLKGGATARAHVAVAVVDESVLALSAYDWQDPASVFYIGAAPDTTDLHNRQFVAVPLKPELQTPPASLSAPMPGSPVAFGVAGGAAGDGEYAHGSRRLSPRAKAESSMLQGVTNGTLSDAELAPPAMEGSGTPISLRTDFSAVAYFNPELLTDDTGAASFEFQAPDNLTRYRVMVVAVQGEQMCGKGESTITARLPLMVKPSAPRFLNFGDKCEIPVVVQNQTDHEMSVELGLRASNLFFDLKDSNDNAAAQASNTCGATVVVPANDRVEVRFPAHTDHDGQAAIDIAASTKDASDAANVNLPVYTPATTEAFAAYGQIDNGAAEEMVELPSNVFEQVGGLELSTSSTALQSLADAYFYVRDYNFSCSEQLSSRVLAVTSLQDFLPAFKKISDTDLQQTKTLTQNDINELCKRQNADGSFGLWKRGENSKWPFMSVQVARALIEAKDKGYDVSAPVLQRANQYLQNIGTSLNRQEYDPASQRTITAYSLFVLKLAHKTDAKKADEIVQASLKQADAGTKNVASLPHLSDVELLNKNLSLESMAWLLPVLSTNTQYARETELLRKAISSHIGETAQNASIEDEPYGLFGYLFFYSPTRRDAVVLESMIMDQPDNDLIPKLAKGLLLHRKAGRWESTQENSAALLALSRYFHTYEKTEPNFNAQTWLGNEFIGQTAFVGRNTATNVLSIPMSFLLQHPQAKDLLLNKEGQGRLYYRIGLNYAPKDLALKAFDNGFTVQRSYEAVDNPSDVQKDANGVWHVKAGATVKAKISMSAPSRRCHVALTDPLPAGLEPINMDLQGNKQISEKENKSNPEDATDEGDSSEQTKVGGFYFPWWRSAWYEYQNLRDFRAEAFSSMLYGGKYEYSYYMRATTPGDYIAPPAKAEEMYSPEISGRSNSDHVIVE